MSQRRGGGAKETAVAEEMVPFSESLDGPSARMTMDRDPEEDASNEPSAVPPPNTMDLESRYEAESKELRIKQWKEGHFAAEMTSQTWREEYQKWRHNFREEFISMDDTDGAPCVCCSAVVCGALGAGRIGHFAILKQSTEWVEEEEEDENGEMVSRRFTRPKLEVVVGPYWPMLMLVTYPLIFGVSIATLLNAIPGKHPAIILFWAACTIGLIYSLAMTSFRDPGILPRYVQAPPHSGGNWRWSDRAHSYRPRGAWFDSDTGVIVEGFDHTCPWTGTAIGAKNMGSFQWFVGLVFVCLILDICLLTGGIP